MAGQWVDYDEDIPRVTGCLSWSIEPSPAVDAVHDVDGSSARLAAERTLGGQGAKGLEVAVKLSIPVAHPPQVDTRR